MTTENTNPPVSPKPQKNKKRNTPLRFVANFLTLFLTLLVLGVGGGVAWLLGTENGLRFAILRLPTFFGSTSIHAEQLNGTIWRGFSGSQIRVSTESADIDISNLMLNWQAKELQNSHVHITELVAGDVHIQPKMVAPNENDNKPLTLPENIGLPFSLAVDKLQVGKITQGKAKTVILTHTDAAYFYNHQQHLLKINTLKNEWSNSDGTFTLKTQSPYAIDGQMKLSGALDDIAVTGDLNVSGSLQDLVLATNINGLGILLHADTQVKPFAATLDDKIGHIKINGKGVNPRAFLSSLPKANLDFDAQVLPSDLDGDNANLNGEIVLHNLQPLPADENGIPVRALSANFDIDQNGVLNVENGHILLMKNGAIALSGSVNTQKQSLNLSAQLDNIFAKDILNQEIDGKLNGKIQATGTFTQPEIQLNVNTGRADVSALVKLITDTQKEQRTVSIEKGVIAAPNGGKLNLSGSLELFNKQKLQFKINSEQLNPQKIDASFPDGRVNGNIDLSGELAEQIFHADMAFSPSQLSGVNLSGGGKISYQNKHLSKADVNIVLGNNVLKTNGAFGKKGDTLHLDLNAPNIAQFGFGLHGLLQAKGSLTSTADGFTQMDANLDGQIRQLNVPNAVQIQYLDFKLHGSPDRARPLDIVLQGKNIVAGGTNIDNADVNLKGTLLQHRLNLSGSLKIDGKPLNLNVAADGGLNQQNQWNGNVSKLDVAGALNVHLQNTLRLEAGANRVSLSPARWQALGGSLNLEKLIWDKSAGLTTKGRADNIHFSELHNWYKPPVEHNLVLAGDWDLSYSQSPRGYLNVRQQSGDVILPTARKQTLNLQNFVLNTQLNQSGILNKLSGKTRYGDVSGSFDILQAFGNGDFSNAPVRGQLLLNVAELETFRAMMPIGQNLRGKLVGNVNIGGRLSAPQLSGTLNGENLYYRHRNVGIVLSDGSLKSHFEGQRWIVDALQFKRGNGTILLTGTAVYANEQPDVNAKIVFNQYQLLDQPSRRLTVSGDTDLNYSPKGIVLTGKLKTDEGKFGFQESSMPTLGDDVVVLGETKETPSESVPLTINLIFDLNDKFYFSGEGLNVNLGGQITLTAKPQQDMQGVGSVHVIRGRYKAYGQDLVIKKGIISFVGPLDTPNLNIRAERRNSPVGAGVEVLGNLSKPRISLVANQPMSEKDKMSWLILNRASSGSSADEAAVATAASAWLAGGLNDKIGLVDDFGLTSGQTRNATTGEMNPAQQMITFGKQLSKDLYLGYEAGLGNASQSVKLVYQLSAAFQAIARAGTESSGAEVKYVKRFDGFSKKKRAQMEAEEAAEQQKAAQ